MSENRPIEQFLKKYGQKRQEGSAPSPELHPATRRLLQGEVTRHYSGAGNSPRRAASFWTRFSLAFSLFLGLGFIVWFLDTKRPDEATLAKVSDKVAATPPLSDTSSNEPAKVNQLFDTKPPPSGVSTAPALSPVARELQLATAQKEVRQEMAGASGDSKSLVAPANQPQELGNLPAQRRSFRSEQAVTLQPQVPNRPAGPAASAAAAPATEKRKTEQMIDGADASTRVIAQQPTSVTTIPQTTPSGLGGAVALARDDRAQEKDVSGGLTARRDSYRFTQAPAPETVALRSRRATTPSPTVMNTFEFSQDGPQIRIVDQDGSLYTGLVVAATSSRGSGGSSPGPELSVVVETNQVWFQAQGTNRTLQRRVLFDGYFRSLQSNSRLEGDAVGQGPAAFNRLAQSTSSVSGPGGTMEINGSVQVGTNRGVVVRAFAPAAIEIIAPASVP